MKKLSRANAGILTAIQEGDINKLIQASPYARLLGVKAIVLGDEVLFHLPANDDNIGNPMLPAIHGGVIGGFMEVAAQLTVMHRVETPFVPKVVDLSLDYLRPGKNLDSYAKCVLVRQGRKVVNVSITAWQENQEKPIATARTHFLLVEG
jgi:acyl-coenzyme A thioesterase PaaI-like protein